MARVPRYEPDIGLTRLETVRASRAAVDQRRGRAGRTEPGVCYRLWDEPQTASLAAYTQPGNPLGRSLLAGARSRAMGRRAIPPTLAFLDPPPAPALKEAKSLLERTRRARWRRPDHRGGQEPARAGAAAAAGAHDRGLASARRRREAADIAAILTERGLGGDSVDLDHRLDQFRRDRSPRAVQRTQSGATLGAAGGRRRERPRRRGRSHPPA